MEPGRGVFVPAEKPHVTKVGQESERSAVPSAQWNLQMQPKSQENYLRHRSAIVERDSMEAPRRPKQSRQSWSKARLAQPARVFGKKVKGHYKDFTSEPAVGGTAAVSAWDSAHHSDLRDDEILGSVHQDLQQHEQTESRPMVGGALVWPVTEDGVRVVWQPF